MVMDMYVSNSIASAQTGDNLAYLAHEAVGETVDKPDDGAGGAHLAGGMHDPSLQVSLSVEALLVLSGAKHEDGGKLPALSDDERNNVETRALSQREYDAFGKYLASGDARAYYRAFIEYFDSLQPQDQASLRYFGTRDAAVAGLRSLAYRDRATEAVETDTMALLDVLLENDRSAKKVEAVQQSWNRPTLQEAENAARIGGRISRANTMYMASF